MRPAEMQMILDVYLAQPHTHLGVDAVMAKLHLTHMRAIHVINVALNEANKHIDFSKRRDQIWPNDA